MTDRVRDQAKRSELRASLLNWYPFTENSRALLLSDDPYLLKLLASRGVSTEHSDEGYDYIILPELSVCGENELRGLLAGWRKALKIGGRLLIAFRNRLGIRYFAGGCDDAVPYPFAGIRGDIRLYSRMEMRDLLTGAGFDGARFYALMPDLSFVQAVWTEECLPGGSFRDRVFSYDPCESPLLFHEDTLYDDLTREGTLMACANAYLAESVRTEEGSSRNPDGELQNCRPDPHRVIYAALSTDREEANRFATVLYADETAEKIALHPDGVKTLRMMCGSMEALAERGLCTVPHEWAGDRIRMPRIRERALLDVLAETVRERTSDEDARRFVFRMFDRLRENVLQSSEPAGLSDEEAKRRWGVDAASLGPVLAAGYIDMIPYNAFSGEEGIRYYDQEFVIPDCPAGYILFRAIRYTWLHIPELESVIPLAGMKARYGIDDVWERYQEEENVFVAKNRNQDTLGAVWQWRRYDDLRARKRCEMLRAGSRKKPYGTGLLMGVFDLFHVGHLRLIRRAKEECSYLRVAILSDRLVAEFKGHPPVIPEEQRKEILEAVREVDEVVVISDTPSRIVEWHRRPFDCFFSGDDYANHPYFAEEKKELQKLGSDLKFFPYTKEQSSTKIRTAADPKNSTVKERSTEYAGENSGGRGQNREEEKRDDSMCKVTVVIPVYNVEKYLPACLDSVLHQTMQDFEIIAIDDATPDRSGEILDEYAERDPRITVIHLPENHMQGYGRNRGLERARGKYVYFLDSDDMIEQSALEEMVAIAETDDLDGLFFDSQTLYETEELRKRHSTYPAVRTGTYEERVYTGPELFDAFAAQNDWNVYVQRQFWKCSYLRDHDIFSPEGIEHEDEYFSFKALLLAGRVRFVPRTWFIRRYRANSVMTRQPMPKDFHGYFTTFCKMAELLEKTGIRCAGADNHISSMYENMEIFYPVFRGEDPDRWFPDPVYRAQFRFYERELQYKAFLQKKETAFWSDLDGTRSVLIYGAGKIAQRTFRRLQNVGIPVDGFIVSSDQPEPATLFGRRVLSAAHAEIAEDEVVIAAMSRAYQEEVLPVLEEKGWHYYWYAMNILEGPFGPERPYSPDGPSRCFA